MKGIQMLRRQAILAAALLAAALWNVACSSTGDRGTARSGNAITMKEFQQTQQQALQNNPRIPPAARAMATQSIEASQAQARQMQQSPTAKTQQK